MLELLHFVLVQTVIAATAAYVAASAWNYRPARLFVLFAINIEVILTASMLRNNAPSPEAAYPLLIVLTLAVANVIFFTMLLFSALFMPRWWEGTRPMVWISLPYLVAIGILVIDLVFRLNWFVSGVQIEHGTYRLQLGAYTPVQFSLALVGAFVPLAIGVVAYMRSPHLRTSIGLLIAAIVITAIYGFTLRQIPALQGLTGPVQTIPFMIALGYTITSTQLFLPSRTALDQALESLDEAVAVANPHGRITFANRSAAQLGLRHGEPLNEQLLALDAEALTRDLRKTAHSNAAETMLIVQQQRYVLNLTSVRDQRGRQRGTLMIARDVSDLLRRTEQIEHERARFSETVAQLEAEQRERALLAATVRNLTFPLIPVLPKVIVIPIIGEFSNEHVQDFVQILLGGIEREHATTAILDVTGVTMLDNAGAQGLATGVNSAHLLGARCILVGIRPEIAQALVALGISLEQISTAPTLQAAVQQYLRLQRNPTALHNAHHQNALS